MAYAFVQDVAASWQQYELIAAATVEPVPDGLILHVAGPTDESSDRRSRRRRRIGGTGRCTGGDNCA
jgi:hypothetical protein